MERVATNARMCVVKWFAPEWLRVPLIRAFLAKLYGLCLEPPSPERAKYPSTGCSPVQLSVRTSVHSFVRLRIHAFNCPFVHPCIHLSVRTSVHSFVRSYIRAFIRPFAHPCIQLSVRTSMHSFVRSHIRAFIRPFAHPCIQLSVRTSMHSFVRSYIRLFVHSFVPG